MKPRKKTTTNPEREGASVGAGGGVAALAAAACPPLQPLQRSRGEVGSGAGRVITLGTRCQEDNFGAEPRDDWEWNIKCRKTNGGLIFNEREHQQSVARVGWVLGVLGAGRFTCALLLVSHARHHPELPQKATDLFCCIRSKRNIWGRLWPAPFNLRACRMCTGYTLAPPPRDLSDPALASHVSKVSAGLPPQPWEPVQSSQTWSKPTRGKQCSWKACRIQGTPLLFSCPPICFM